MWHSRGGPGGARDTGVAQLTCPGSSVLFTPLHALHHLLLAPRFPGRGLGRPSGMPHPCFRLLPCPCRASISTRPGFPLGCQGENERIQPVAAALSFVHAFSPLAGPSHKHNRLRLPLQATRAALVTRQQTVLPQILMEWNYETGQAQLRGRYQVRAAVPMDRLARSPEGRNPSGTLFLHASLSSPLQGPALIAPTSPQDTRRCFGRAPAPLLRGTILAHSIGGPPTGARRLAAGNHGGGETAPAQADTHRRLSAATSTGRVTTR